MKKEFVKYEQALALKELGFDGPCFGFYTHNEKLCRYGSTNDSVDFQMCTHSEIYNTYSLSPTFSQAFRWFREKYDLRIWIESNYGVLKFEYVIATTNFNFIDKQFNDLSGYKTYEEAESACLDKLIEIVKNKEDE